MIRCRRFIVWLLVLAFVAPLPLAGALASSGCEHEGDGIAVVDDGAHAHHAMPMDDTTASHPCCQNDPAVPQANACDGDHCSGCVLACSVISSLPAAPIGIGFEPSPYLSAEPAQTNHSIYPQVPHQPPRV